MIVKKLNQMINDTFEFLRDKHAESTFKAWLINSMIALPFLMGIQFLFESVFDLKLEGAEGFMFEFLVFLTLYIGFDHALSTRQERRNRLHSLRSGARYFYHNHLWSLIQGVVVLGLIIAFVELQVDPKDPWVLMVYKTFNGFSTFFLMGYFLLITFQAAINGAFQDNYSMSDLYASFRNMVALITAILGITAFIGNFGDDIYLSYQEKPEEMMAKLVALAMLSIAFTLKNLMNHSYCSVSGTSYQHSSYATASMAKAKPSYDMSQASIEQTAYHEAGHALFFACLKPYSPNMQLVVKGHYEEDKLGYVTGLGQYELDPTKDMMEWAMLRNLAGDRANVVFQGQSNSGAGSDHHNWIHRAKRYLEEQYKGTYYASPENLLEQSCNNMLLDSLRNEQNEIVDRFLLKNKSVIEGIVEAVLTAEDMTLNRKNLAKFMDLVVITDGIPVIKN